MLNLLRTKVQNFIYKSSFQYIFYRFGLCCQKGREKLPVLKISCIFVIDCTSV